MVEDKVFPPLFRGMSWNCASIIQKWYMNQWTSTPQIISHIGLVTKVRLFRCWLIAKPGNKTAVPSWPEPHTIKCSFDVVHLITTFSHSTAMAAEKKHTEQASHTSPKRASYGCHMRILEKMDCIITAPHCACEVAYCTRLSTFL